ncbi:ABC transporter ATP-binding protein [Apilactobacillus xinyiensis]|uniref:ABC transporter ATP-binding protein n=1 Tax=Apilactobacillus xinyiensis TaxID=2841032 RepID=UPI001C7CACCB|nr:ABC transporter ATP-binding protein [Apilactobacillus xinyiensis]
MLQIENLNYQINKNWILKNVNLKFPKNSISIIQGPSGCGKSTLLKCIAKLYPKHSNGKISGNIKLNNVQNFNNLSVNNFCKEISIMFQNPNYQFAMSTVEEELIFTLENLQIEPNLIGTKIINALKFCNIESLKKRKINTLSGGEKQKVSLAIIYAMNSNIILLDEPFVNVDINSQKFIIHKLNELKETKTIIIVDHNAAKYNHIADYYYKFDEQNLNFKITELNQSELNKVSNFTIKRNNQNKNDLITLDNFQLSSGTKSLLNIKHFSFKNGITLLTGDNGTGKSSLFKAILKRQKYIGEVLINQVSINKIRSKKFYKTIGLIFQQSDTQFIKITVKEEMELSSKQTKNCFYSDKQIQTMLVKAGLDGILNRVIYTLSEGQKKKVQIISMLIMSNPILLLDEPFNGLDDTSFNQMVDILTYAKNHFNQNMIIISHQTKGLEKLVDQQVQLKNHKLIEIGSDSN